MRLLCDANLGSKLANALTQAGHDVTRSIHAVGQSAPDKIVLAHAVEDGRFLLTCDSDFGELVFLHGAQVPPGIVYIRFEPEDVMEIVPRVLRVLDPQSLTGHMVVIGDAGDRWTPFPDNQTPVSND